MATNIQIKRGSGSNTPSSLLQGELAVNMDTGQLYYGSGSTETPVNSYKFTNVTASGDISASGTVSALSYTGLPSGLISGSSQLPSGIISGSSQLPSGIISGSSQLPSGLISGSSQLPSGIISSSAQLPSGIYSSSTQILGNITSSGNISASGYVSASSFIGDGSQLTNVVADEATLVELACKNTSGGTLTKGTPVYITGTVGASSRVEVSAASASLSAKMPAIGLLKQDLANNGEGFIVIGGLLTNLSTDPINGDTPSEGDVLYVHSDGGLALNKPSGSNLIQNVGKVGKVNGSGAGSIIVSSILRSNDVPNLLESQIFFGSGSNQTQQIHISGALDSTVINNITASGNISSSGTGSFDYLQTPTIEGSGSTTILDVEGNISASGNISGSNVFASSTISASGVLLGNQLTVTKSIPKIVLQTNTSNVYSQLDGTSGNVRIDVDNGNQIASSTFGVRLDAAGTNQLSLNSTGDLTLAGTVSASGFVSASSFAGSGSQIIGVVSSSYALTASHALNAAGTVSSSAQIEDLGFALTSSVEVYLNFEAANTYHYVVPYDLRFDGFATSSVFTATFSSSGASYTFGSTLNQFSTLHVTASAAGLVLLSGSRV